MFHLYDFPYNWWTIYAGGILSACGSGPFQKALSSDWADLTDGFQKSALESRLGIPLIYGVDAVHGHSSVYGATIFPHNIGLGATRFVLDLWSLGILHNCHFSVFSKSKTHTRKVRSKKIKNKKEEAKAVSFIAYKFIYSIQIKSSYFIQNQQQEHSLLLHLINLKMLEKKKMELII